MRSYGPKTRTQADKLQSALLAVAYTRDDKIADLDAGKLCDREGVTQRGARQQVAYALAQRQQRLAG